MFKFFAINNSNTGTAWFVLIFACLASILTALVTLPELIYLIKTKKTQKNIKWFSFWVFYIALMGWIIIGGYGADYENKMSAALYANIICGYLFSFVLWLMYRYSESTKKQKRQYWILGGCLSNTTLFASAGFIGLYANNSKYHVDANTMGVLMIIIPMLTSFAFLPQIFKNFEIKNFSAMSRGLVLSFIIVNIVWIIYWIALMIHGRGITPSLLAALTWQFMSLLIYLTQFSAMIQEKKMQKKAQEEIESLKTQAHDVQFDKNTIQKQNTNNNFYESQENKMSKENTEEQNISK